MRRHGGGLLEGPDERDAQGDRPSGGYFAIRRLPANGHGRAVGGGNPLEASAAEICRARAVLRIPGDRILCRGGIRTGIEMVEKDLQAATFVGFAAVDGARKEVLVLYRKRSGAMSFGET